MFVASLKNKKSKRCYVCLGIVLLQRDAGILWLSRFSFALENIFATTVAG